LKLLRGFFWWGIAGALSLLCSLSFAQLAARSSSVAPSGSLASQAIEIEYVHLKEGDSVAETSLLKLPMLSYRPERSFKRMRATAVFDLAQVGIGRRWSLYFLSLLDGGRIWINGHEVGDVLTADAHNTVRHVRPFMFNIPVQYLKTGRNVMELEWVSRETMLSVSRIFVGPEEIVLPHYRSRLFWQNSMAQVAFVFALIISSLMLGVYARQRTQTQYLLVGLSALGWAVLNVGYFLPPMPSWFFPYWRFFFYGMIGLFAASGWLYVLRESSEGHHGYAMACKIWALAGPVGYLIQFSVTGDTYFFWVEGVWAVGCSLMGLYPLLCLLRVWWQKRLARHLLYLFSATAAMSVGAADASLLVGQSPFGSVGYSLQVVAPLWFGSVVVVLIADFVRSLRLQEEQRYMMDLRLKQQEKELQRLHEQESLRTQEKAALDERERIMQDMHDGLGSQLISSLALSQGGQLSAKQTQELLRGCIDDLRLAIDASGGDAHDLSVAAGNLRFRMAPRLKAAGIELVWQTQGLGDRLPLTAPQVLAVLRIVQEAIANTIKHARASSLEVTLRSDDQKLTVSVEDNGLGLDRTLPPQSRGKGLAGMEKRARNLHASLRVISPMMHSDAQHPGTRVELVLPLK
jgi:signal transduction histidine kinase